MSKSNPNKWLIFMNLPIQMGVIIGGGVWLGIKIDKTYDFSPWGTVLFSLISIGIALYTVIKQIQKMNS